MDEIGLRYQPVDMQIDRTELTDSLSNLGTFVQQRPHLWYTVINDRPITRDWIERSLAGLRFS